MSVQLVDEIKNRMQEKSTIVEFLQQIIHKLTQENTPENQLLNLHKDYQKFNNKLEELDVTINTLIEQLNKYNSRELRNILNYREIYTSDTFGEKISDISAKVRNEYLTIMSLDKKLIKDLYEIDKSYNTVLK